MSRLSRNSSLRCDYMLVPQHQAIIAQTVNALPPTLRHSFVLKVDASLKLAHPGTIPTDELLAKVIQHALSAISLLDEVGCCGGREDTAA